MKHLARFYFLLIILPGGQALANTADEYRQQRAQLIRSIERNVRETAPTWTRTVWIRALSI